MTLRRRGYRTPSKYKGLTDVQWRVLRLIAMFTKHHGHATRGPMDSDWTTQTLVSLEKRGFIEQVTPQTFDRMSRPEKYRTTDIGMTKALERGPIQ